MSESILFLDDCPRRCKRFRSLNPAADIVHTAVDCIERLKVARDLEDEDDELQYEEVHLDHDLNGETYCDSDRDDCGMEVVRWVLLNSPDVRTFVVHTCNEIAGPIMVQALESAGYRVVYAPFRFI